MLSKGQQHRVLIVGGGPAGLLTAHALKKRGIASTVFEKDSGIDARSRDWSFGIYWAQSPLADCLTEELSKEVILNGQIDNRPLDPNGVLPIYNGETAELMKAVPAPNNLRLHRRNFLRILRNGLDIRYGKKLRHMESDGTTATVHFEDGTSESGSLVIGAEGARSKVREFLLGEEKAMLSKVPIASTAVMGILPSEAAKAITDLHPRYVIAFHPAGTFTWISVHDAFANTKPGDWTFWMIHTWPTEQDYDAASLQGPAILSDLKQRAKSFGEPFRTTLESIPEGTQCWHNQLTYWVTTPWDNHNSTVTLVGDAAHPMTFHRGQGLNNAIHDVALLANLLAEKGFSVPEDGSGSAVTMYEREMWERGREAVLSSKENTLAIHNWDTLLQSPLFRSGLNKESKREEANGADVKTEVVNDK